MEYNFLLHPDAEEEFEEAYVWYGLQKDDLGRTFEVAVLKTIKQICANPELYSRSVKKYREAMVAKFPFVVVFKINQKQKMIEISAIHHTARNPKHKYKK